MYNKSITDQLDYPEYLGVLIAEEDIPKQIFFDAKDTIQVIKGFEDVYNGVDRHDFNRDMFDREDFLVTALIASQRLRDLSDRFYMFSPHQDEFLYNLEHQFTLAGRTKPDSAFFVDYAIKAGVMQDEKGFERMTKAQKELAVRRIVKIGRKQFKVASSIYMTEWKQRLKYFLRTDPILGVYSQEFSSSEIIQHECFQKLLDGYHQLRGAQRGTGKNLADATALTLLQMKVEKFNAGESETIPILYSSSYHAPFEQVIEFTGLEENFHITANGKRSSVIRRPRYFVMASLLSKRTGQVKEQDHQVIAAHFSKADEFRERFEELEKREGQISELEELNRDIEEYVDVNFFKNVMLDFYEDASYQSVFDTLDVNLETVNDSTFREMLDADVKKISKEMINSYSSLKSVSDIWVEIHTSVSELRKNIINRVGKVSKVQVVRDFGLMRFSLPEGTGEAVQELFGEQGILAPRNDAPEIEAKKVRLLELLTSCNEKKCPLLDLSIGLAGLWILESWDLILKLTEDRERVHFSVALIRAAAMMKQSSRNQKELGRIMRSLEDKLEQQSNPNRANIMLGLAYLHSQFIPQETSFSYSKKAPSKLYHNSPEEKAVRYANSAYKSFMNVENDNSDSELELIRIYAFNVFMHIGVEFSTEEYFFDKILNEELADTFSLNRGSHPEYWHFRFEDTLARYHYRLSLMFPQSEITELDIALKYAQRADNNPIGDIGIQEYRNKLESRWTVISAKNN